MITTEKIKNEFEYVSDSENGDLYSGTWPIDSQPHEMELYFMSKNKSLTNSQLESFQLFLKNKEKIKEDTEAFIIKDLNKQNHKDTNKLINGTFTFDIVTIFESEKEYDTEIICSKNYKGFLSKKRIDYVIALKNGEILEIIGMNK